MKLTNLRNEMRQKGMDAVFVTAELNQRYFLGYPFTDGLLLITQKSAYMVTDFRYEEEARKYADPAFEVVTPKLRTAFMQEILHAEKVRTVGYEDLTLTVAEFRNYEERFADQTFVPLGNLFEKLREFKSEDEVALMARAQSITDAAFSHLLTVLTPTMTETEVALELEFEMRRLGADGLAFETIAVSGDASALPHGHPRNEKLHAGFLTMDFGAKYKGYCSDMTRTVVIGRADQEMKRLYQTVLDAQLAGIAAVRAGADCAATDGVARTLIDKAGYEGCFGHSLGHGVGLFIHEKPRLSSAARGEQLVAGQVVTVEPGIYLTGRYGCRIEDMVLVEKDGCHDFTGSTKELIEIM
jgi:Xaa-Pro aminopeptidase